MTKEETKILNDSLSRLFKIDSETLASLYNEAGELTDFSKVIEFDAERVKKFKSDSDNQFKRGVKETMAKFEKELKEKYEVDSELQGVDLIDHIVVEKVNEAKVAGTKDITKHPEYIKLQVSIPKLLKERDREWEDKIVAKDREYNKARLFEKVREKALMNLSGRNPILPQDPRKAQVWKETYLNDLRNANYQEGEDGKIIVLNTEEKPMTSPHGNIITFEEFEKDIADKYFEYQVADQRSSSGNKPESGTGNVNMPKTEDEYFARLRDPKITPDERIKLTEYWKSKK
jgi:hypothetical protein